MPGEHIPIKKAFNNTIFRDAKISGTDRTIWYFIADTDIGNITARVLR